MPSTIVCQLSSKGVDKSSNTEATAIRNFVLRFDKVPWAICAGPE